ncbi:Uncharacterised protein [Leminorella richardii]|uniref:DUF1795 domain-containing protein n=2 Tax=Leminorella richardii TaxID=158841 RepID=A0A2X4VCA6_9GAMM|nr:Uncharacterised protein [Leminorella richardii]
MNKTWKWVFGAACGMLFSFQASAQVDMVRQQLPEQGISIDIPKGFTPMDEMMKKMKYPSENRPNVIFTDEKGKVNVAINAGMAPLRAEQLDVYKDFMLKAMSNYQPTAEEVTLDGGKKAWLISFVSKAVDTDIHNTMLVTSVKDKAVIAAFNATKDQWDIYKDSVKPSLLSIKFEESAAK